MFRSGNVYQSGFLPTPDNIAQKIADIFLDPGEILLSGHIIPATQGRTCGHCWILKFKKIGACMKFCVVKSALRTRLRYTLYRQPYGRNLL